MSHYNYQHYSADSRVEATVRKILERMGFTESPVLTREPYCRSCAQSLEPSLDGYSQVLGYKPHQPGDCIRFINQRLLVLERKLSDDSHPALEVLPEQE